MEVRSEQTDLDEFVDLNKLLPKLTANPPVTAGRPRIEADAVSRVPLKGRSAETEHEQEQICDSNGHHCETITRKRTVMKDNKMTMRTAGGSLCFDHGGTLNKQTQWVVLVLSPPSHPDAETHRYAWQFSVPGK